MDDREVRKVGVGERPRPKLPLYAFDAESARPLRDLMLVRVFDEGWSQRRGLWLPPGVEGKGDSPKDYGGVVSKTHAQEVLVLAVGPEVKDVRPGMRVIIPTHSAVGGCVFNETTCEGPSGRPGKSYDFFMPEARRRWEHFRDPRTGKRVSRRVTWGVLAVVEGD